jgi:hypothetical protein
VGATAPTAAAVLAAALREFVEAISVGAPAYNGGDHRRCRDIYVAAVERLCAVDAVTAHARADWSLALAPGHGAVLVGLSTLSLPLLLSRR